MSTFSRTNVRQTREALLRRITAGDWRPGERFLSARRICAMYPVSYQTAHRISRDLVEAGYLERRGRSGTYIAGSPGGYHRVDLVFNARARRRDSFGQRLLDLVSQGLDRYRILWRLNFDGRHHSKRDDYQVFWEMGDSVCDRLASRGFALLLGQRPPHGVLAASIDTVETDDFCGGVCAGEMLRDRMNARRPLVIGGPVDDLRSRERMQGFQAVFPDAAVFHSRSWFFEDGVRLCQSIDPALFDGCFCANDRLAQAFYSVHKPKPGYALVGFDGAPIARQLGIATVDIAWEEQAALAVRLIQNRLQGDTGVATRHIVAPKLLVN